METIQVERQDGIVTVTLNRPERKNALNQRMYDELRQTFASMETSDRVLILTGADGAFCSGADLSEPPSDLSTGSGLRLMRENMTGTILGLHELTIPTIAAVNGVAVGGGLGLALACDLVIASDAAKFSFIFSKRGLSLDGGSSWILPRLIGLQRAKELAFLADFVTPAQALELGLVNRVVPAAELNRTVLELAKQLKGRAPVALSLMKRALNASFSMTLPEALEREAISQSVLFGTEDAAEAMMAFVEKRDPQFKGR